jgi:hypothetical protein
MAGYLSGIEIIKEMLRRYPPSQYPHLYGLSGQMLKSVEPLGHNSPYAVKLIEESNGRKKETFVADGIPTRDEAIVYAYMLEDYPPMIDVLIIDQFGGRVVWQYSVNSEADRNNKRYALCYAFYSYTGEPRYDIKGVYFSDSVEKLMDLGRRVIEHTGERDFLIVDRMTKRVVHSFSEVPPDEYEMWGNFYV